MQIKLDTTKTVHQNASQYFEKSKKSKLKIQKVREVLAKAKKDLAEALKVNLKVESSQKTAPSSKSTHWYEKFRWFFTSSNSLGVGGKDANTNEIILKSHVEPTDTIFHTELPGSPFFVLKEKDASEQVKEEVSQLTGVYSKAWKAGYASSSVFCVKPDQVSKHAQSGEYVAKGAFMIRGQKQFYHPPVELCIGEKDGQVIIGTRVSIRAQTKNYKRIRPGRIKSTIIAKEIAKLLGVHVDLVTHIMPTGGAAIGK